MIGPERRRFWLSDPLGDDLSQSLPLIRRIEASGKQLAGCLMPRSGALDGDPRIATEGDQFRPALKPVLLQVTDRPSSQARQGLAVSGQLSPQTPSLALANRLSSRSYSPILMSRTRRCCNGGGALSTLPERQADVGLR